MRNIDIVFVLLTAVARHAEITYHIACGDDLPLIHIGVGVISPQMCIIIVPLAVETPYAYAPAAVTVPTDGFHITGFDGDYRRADTAEHIMPEMAAAMGLFWLSQYSSVASVPWTLPDAICRSIARNIA